MCAWLRQNGWFHIWHHLKSHTISKNIPQHVPSEFAYDLNETFPQIWLNVPVILMARYLGAILQVFSSEQSITKIKSENERELTCIVAGGPIHTQLLSQCKMQAQILTWTAGMLRWKVSILLLSLWYGSNSVIVHSFGGHVGSWSSIPFQSPTSLLKPDTACVHTLMTVSGD